MRRALKLHPASSCRAVSQIEVQATRRDPLRLILNYYVDGKIDGLLLAPASTPLRANELWRHSCFEAFVSSSPSDAYCEFNFAPSHEWAVYKFDTYRCNMREIGDIEPPRIETSLDDTRYQMRVSLALDGVPDLSGEAIWRLGLSAIIEEKKGQLSYWALAHPPGKADFHHDDCFALKLPPREQA